MKSATLVELGEQTTARVITPPLFVATKLAAFHDRGRMDLYCSHDLEDIVTIVDGRKDIVDSIASSAMEVRQFIVESLCALLENVDFDEALIGHLPTTFGARERSSEVKKKFETIAGVG